MTYDRKGIRNHEVRIEKIIWRKFKGKLVRWSISVIAIYLVITLIRVQRVLGGWLGVGKRDLVEKCEEYLREGETN